MNSISFTRFSLHVPLEYLKLLIRLSSVSSATLPKMGGDLHLTWSDANHHLSLPKQLPTIKDRTTSAVEPKGHPPWRPATQRKPLGRGGEPRTVTLLKASWVNLLEVGIGLFVIAAEASHGKASGRVAAVVVTWQATYDDLSSCI